MTLLYLLSILVWGGDIKPRTSGEGLFVQLPILIAYILCFAVVFVRLRLLGARLAAMRWLIAAVAAYLFDSILAGCKSGQTSWPLVSNAINVMIYLSAALMTFMVLSMHGNRARLLSAMKTVSLI